MIKHFLVAYDIPNDRRAYRVRKIVYALAIGGQKSALELLLKKSDLRGFIGCLELVLGHDDKVNIIEVEEECLLFGKADHLDYDEGVIIV